MVHILIAQPSDYLSVIRRVRKHALCFFNLMYSALCSSGMLGAVPGGRCTAEICHHPLEGYKMSLCHSGCLEKREADLLHSRCHAVQVMLSLRSFDRSTLHTAFDQRISTNQWKLLSSWLRCSDYCQGFLERFNMAQHAIKQAICCCAHPQCVHYKQGDNKTL